MEVFGLRAIDAGRKKLQKWRTPVRLKLKMTLERQPNGGAPEKEEAVCFLFFVRQQIKAAIMKRRGFTLLRPRTSQTRHHLTRRWSFTDVDSSLFDDLSGQLRFPIAPHVHGVNLNSLR